VVDSAGCLVAMIKSLPLMERRKDTSGCKVEQVQQEADEFEESGEVWKEMYCLILPLVANR
jgi:hypothetical protein